MSDAKGCDKLAAAHIVPKSNHEAGFPHARRWVVDSGSCVDIVGVGVVRETPQALDPRCASTANGGVSTSKSLKVALRSSSLHSSPRAKMFACSRVSASSGRQAGD